MISPGQDRCFRIVNDMSKWSKRDIERHYFELFRNQYPLPEGTIEYGDKPDVILRGEQIIGIEMTNFFLEDGTFTTSEQIQSRARDQVVVHAQRIYEAKGRKKCELTLGFDKAIPIRDRHRLAKKVAALAARVEGRKTGELGRDDFRDIPELSFAYLNADEYEDAHWRVCQVYTTPTMSLEALKKIIKDKEAKIRGYKSCDSYWLLVIVDFIDRAQDQEIRIDGLESIESNVFEKMVVYKTLFGHILEIDTNGAPAHP